MTRNRIVGLTTKRASELTANPLNWRSHPTAQRSAVSASLQTLGWVDVVIENIETGYLVDGHERVWQAMERDEMVPVLQVRLSLDEERLALAILDPLTSMAKTDGTVLDELLSVIACTNETLSAVLDTIATTSGLLSGDHYGDEAFESHPSPEYSSDDELQPNHVTCPECGAMIATGHHKGKGNASSRKKPREKPRH